MLINSKNWRAPVIWDKTFSKILLEVAKELNIDITGEVNAKQNCLFIRITCGTYYKADLNGVGIISGSYSKEANANANINGFDYDSG